MRDILDDRSCPLQRPQVIPKAARADTDGIDNIRPLTKPYLRGAHIYSRVRFGSRTSSISQSDFTLVSLLYLLNTLGQVRRIDGRTEINQPILDRCNVLTPKY